MTIGPTIPSIYLDRRLENDTDYGLNLVNPGAESCIKWLDKMEKGTVIYASFGTLASLSENQMEEIACGLKNSGRYLWVVRDSEETKASPRFHGRNIKERTTFVFFFIFTVVFSLGEKIHI